MAGLGSQPGDQAPARQYSKLRKSRPPQSNGRASAVSLPGRQGHALSDPWHKPAGIYRPCHLVRVHPDDQRGRDRSLQPGEDRRPRRGTSAGASDIALTLWIAKVEGVETPPGSCLRVEGSLWSPFAPLYQAEMRSIVGGATTFRAMIVRWRTRSCRLRCNIRPDCCCSDFVATNRLDGRVTASQMARWNLIDFIRANADARRLQTADDTTASLRVPEFSVECPDGSDVSISQLRGRILHLIFAGPQSDARLHQLRAM